MSKYYSESNRESTFELFNKRTIYKHRAQSSVRTAKNIIDFNVGERSLFGKVDYYFSPMFIKFNSNLKQLRSVDPKENFFAVNFVADLFNEMSYEFDRCVATGQIAKDDPFLSSLRVYKAYEDPLLKYREYRKIFFDAIRDKFVRHNIEVENFDHFLEEFIKIARLTLKTMPITFPGFIKSRTATTLTTGLAIEIADLSYDNDEEKKEAFLKSKNWKFFVNACNKYGFMIDYNIPWRIVCDFKTPHLQKYIQPYYPGARGFMDMAYKRAALEYFPNMAQELLTLYNTVRRNMFTKLSYCDGAERRVTVRPPLYTVYDIIGTYGYEYFFKLYMKLRLWEEKPEIDDYQRRALMKDVILDAKMQGNYVGVETKFERFINKPFDKRFSITYHINVGLPAKMEAAREGAEGEPQAYSLTELGTSTGY